jgi:2-iminobutanoate/2-iminopropanoate deaminase
MNIIDTHDAPRALGPYSQAVALDAWIFTAGQIGIDPTTGELAGPDFETQARQTLSNLHNVLAAAGCSFADVVKSTIYVTDLDDFARLNELYGEAMAGHMPARSTVQVSALPLGARVEIDMIARAAG